MTVENDAQTCVRSPRMLFIRLPTLQIACEALIVTRGNAKAQRSSIGRCVHTVFLLAIGRPAGRVRIFLPCKSLPVRMYVCTARHHEFTTCPPLYVPPPVLYFFAYLGPFIPQFPYLYGTRKRNCHKSTVLYLGVLYSVLIRVRVRVGPFTRTRSTRTSTVP